MYHSSMAALGLAFDMVGAILIAVPDARILFSQITPGALQQATSRLALGRVTKQDTGYQPLVNIVRKTEPIAEFGAENGGTEYTEVLINARTGLQGEEAANHPDFDYGDRYLEARYTEDGDCAETDFYNVNDVLDTITARERPTTTQFRSFGMLALLSGFTLQLLSAIRAPFLSVYVVIVAMGIVTIYLWSFRESMN